MHVITLLYLSPSIRFSVAKSGISLIWLTLFYFVFNVDQFFAGFLSDFNRSRPLCLLYALYVGPIMCTLRSSNEKCNGE